MADATITFGFPLAIDAAGRVNASGGDEAIRGKIIQVLFTAPGERVNQPTFGCGLFNLVFEPNNDVLVPAMEFTIRQALVRWMADEIITDGVSVNSSDETVIVEIAYRKKQDLSQQAVRIHFR
ncbi:MAG TPA: GPW/gp25 family protein [Burkholderiales bacterium]|nr:GPW/gp25 family protein [Burkholderiales bacterium]